MFGIFVSVHDVHKQMMSEQNTKGEQQQQQQQNACGHFARKLVVFANKLQMKINNDFRFSFVLHSAETKSEFCI